VPFVFFQRVAHAGRSKGNVRFQGFGIVARAERVTQYDRYRGVYFSNYVFEFAVFDLSAEHEVFDWVWISARRDRTKTLNETGGLAPKAWKEWLKHGRSVTF